jgi:hypothetical protein
MIERKLKADLTIAALTAYAYGHTQLGLFIEDIISGRPAFIVHDLPTGVQFNLPPEINYDVRREEDEGN